VYYVLPLQVPSDSSLYQPSSHPVQKVFAEDLIQLHFLHRGGQADQHITNMFIYRTIPSASAFNAFSAFIEETVGHIDLRGLR